MVAFINLFHGISTGFRWIRTMVPLFFWPWKGECSDGHRNETMEIEGWRELLEDAMWNSPSTVQRDGRFCNAWISSWSGTKECLSNCVWTHWNTGIQPGLADWFHESTWNLWLGNTEIFLCYHKSTSMSGGKKLERDGARWSHWTIKRDSMMYIYINVYT